MARSFMVIFAFAFLGNVVAEGLPPKAIQPMAVGFAEGFISDSPDLMVCGTEALGSVVKVEESMKDLGNGLRHFNLTIVEGALKEFADAIHGISGVKAACEKVVTDINSIIAKLRKIKGPKDLATQIVDDIFDDSDKFFGGLAAAEHAYKTGWDYMTSGQQLGMATRVLLLGGEPPLAPMPPGAKKSIAAGIAIGFVSDGTNLKKCGQELENDSQEFSQAVKELKDGIRQLNITVIKDAAEKFETLVKEAGALADDCKDASKTVVADVEAIISAIAKIKGPKDFIIHIVANMFDDGEKIFTELGEAGKEYKGSDYFGAGRQLGMAFRRMIVAEAVPPSGTMKISELVNIVV